jgi:uncharacterized membrane protein (DUF106 family)
MHIVNTLLGHLFAAIMWPFRQAPTLGLVLISAVASVGILYIFKWVSNQDRLDDIKRRIHASLFEIRLFNDDLRAILRAQLDILRHNLSYLRLQLVPLLFILPPVIVLLAQLQPYYGYRGLEVGEPVLFQVAMRPHGSSDPGGFELGDKPPIRLDVPAGLTLETPAVWVPSKGELTWRLAADSPGDYTIGVEIGGESFAKSVRVTDETVRRSPRRVSSWSDQFLYPVEDPLTKASPIRAITLAYPEDPELLLMPRWMWIFFVLTMVFAFALRKPLKVTI